MSYRKKLIEVVLPLGQINAESAHEKPIRHGHPSTLLEKTEDGHMVWTGHSRRSNGGTRGLLSAHPTFARFPWGL